MHDESDRLKEAVLPVSPRRRALPLVNARRWAACFAAVLVGTVALAAGPTPVGAQQEQRPGLMLTELEESRRLDAELNRILKEERYGEALPIAERALMLSEKVFGSEHPNVATSLHRLAFVCHKTGNIERAEALFKRSLAIREKADGATHPSVAQELINLGALYQMQGDHVRAEPLLQRALTIRESALGPEHLDVADSLGRLAALYLQTAEYARAKPIIRRAIQIQEKALGPDHPNLREDLGKLVWVCMNQRDYKEAEPVLRRILTISEKAFGPDHPDLAHTLNNLGGLYWETGAYDRAEPLFERALAISEKALGPRHPGLAVALCSMAGLYQVKGDFDRAASLFRRALRIEEGVLDPNHPQLALTLEDLAGVLAAQTNTEEAVRLWARASEIQGHYASLLSTVGPKQQRLAFVEERRLSTFIAVSLHMRSAPTSLAAARLALGELLRNKGSTFDATADTFEGLRGRLDRNDQILLDRLASSRLKLADVRQYERGTIARVGLSETIVALDQESRKLEEELGARSAEFRAEQQPVTIEQVKVAIPEGAVLLEISLYRSFNPAKADNRFGGARYAAYLLRRSGDISWFDLGEATTIDAAVEDLRRSHARHSTDPRAAARALDALVMQPIRSRLGGVRRILLSPDGALALVPFGALLDEEGRYLIERYTMTYVSSGRDLVRLTEAGGSRQGAIVIAAPDFGALEPVARPTGGETDDTCSEPGSTEAGAMTFSPLPNAAEEARVVAREIVGARLLVGGQATEEAVKALHGPRILHLATRVSLLPPTATHPRCRPQAGHKGGGTSPAGISGPMMSTRIALAGANRRSGATSDGILTPLEVSALDLYGTKLVVLPACETAAGGAPSGDSLNGIRRALVTAGAETQVMSLWRGDDDATRELMTAYYTKLREGSGRSEAMREAQLAMLGQTGRSHPYYWSSFLVSGSEAALDGRLGTPAHAKASPGPRGCACSVVGTGDGMDPSSFLLSGAVLWAFARRRRDGRTVRRKPHAARFMWVLAGLWVFVLTPKLAEAQPSIRSPSTKEGGEATERLGEAIARLSGEGQFGDAILLVERTLVDVEKKRGPKHPDVASTLDMLIKLYLKKGDLGPIEPLAQRALVIRQQAFGPKHLAVARSLNNLAVLYVTRVDHYRAEPLFQQALAIEENALGPPQIAHTLTNLAALYADRRDFDKAEPLFQRALTITVKHFGSDHERVASSTFNMALMYRQKGDYARAETLHQRSVTIREKALGPDHLETIAAARGLAELYLEKEDPGRAGPILLHALAVRERVFGTEHPEVAEIQYDLANLYTLTGDYVRAETFAKRALLTRERLLGQKHVLVVSSLDNLSMVYFNQHDYEQARQLQERALAIAEEALGPEHPDTGYMLGNLAAIYGALGDHERAVRLFWRCVTAKEKRFGPEHPDLASNLTNLAALYYKQEDYERAEPLLQRALRIEEKAFGPNSPAVASTLMALGGLYYSKGDYARAVLLANRALAIREAVLGPEHTDTAESLNNLSLLYVAQGSIELAVRARERGSEIQDRNAMLLLATGSEEQKRALLTAHQRDPDETVSLHTRTANDDPRAARLALTAILRRKGRILYEQTSGFAMLRDHLTKEDQTLLNKLTAVQSELAARLLRASNGAHRGQARADPEIGKLDEQRREIEAEISRRSAAFRAEYQPVNLEKISAAIPEGAALVEIFKYWPLRVRQGQSDKFWDPPRYVAYVLRRNADVSWADLGEAAIIEAGVERFRRALYRRALDPEKLARELDARVMQPVRALLGGTRSILLSPDGALNLVPFGALVDEDGRYLVERYAFTYLTSGRDLVRLEAPTWPRQGATVVAAPDFDAPRSASPPDREPESSAREPRHAELPTMTFAPLQGAVEEAHAVRRELVDAKLFMGAEATERALKGVRGPRILHIATHGFFLPARGRSSGNSASGVSWNPSSGSVTPVSDDSNPMLRAGLALAGANRPADGSDDGVLTALEASGLDLYGTKLVVLSACETGLGEMSSGEGLYGLRRALVMAGAETLVMSLWRVDDAAMRELMTAYYAKLQAGGGRSEAMREVQIAMLQQDPKLHPHQWASFIVSGSAATLDGATVTPDFTRVRPGPRGCACAETSPGRDDGWSGIVLLGAVLSIAARRKRPRAVAGPILCS